MTDGGITVIDGTLLRSSIPHLQIPNGAVTGADLLKQADSIVSANLFGLLLPENIKSAALERISGDYAGFSSSEFDVEKSASVLRNYIIAIADELKDDPLVISVLDGSALRLFLDDEDDFAMLAENLFTDLDTDDTGKLRKAEIRSALIQMGVDMGVPPFSECGALLNDILRKHGAKGEEELGQAQFAQLLQPILQDLADALAEKPVVLIQNIKINNGSKLRKVLGDEELLNAVTEEMVQELTLNEDKVPIGKIRGFLEKEGLKLGLPSAESNEAVVLLYDQIFSETDKGQHGGEFHRNEFGMVAKSILEKFAEQLEANPIFSDLES